MVIDHKDLFVFLDEENEHSFDITLGDSCEEGLQCIEITSPFDQQIIIEMTKDQLRQLAKAMLRRTS